MKHLKDYYTNKLKAEQQYHVDHYTAQVRVIEALIKQVDSIFFKNGKSRFKTSAIRLGDGCIKAEQSSGGLVLIERGYNIIRIDCDVNCKNEILSAAKKALDESIDGLSISKQKLDSFDHRLKELDELLDATLELWRSAGVARSERDDLWDAIRYKIVASKVGA